MSEHTGEQDKVDAWKAQQHRLSEHQQETKEVNWFGNLWSSAKSTIQVIKNSVANIASQISMTAQSARDNVRSPVVGGGGTLSNTSSSIGGVEILIILAAVAIIAVWTESGKSHFVYNKVCNTTIYSTLADCFHYKGRWSFNPKYGASTDIDTEDFNNLTSAVYSDIKDLDWYRLGWDPARKYYDTPFTNAGNPEDYVVCVLDRCDNQTYVNYFAQGMYSASAEETVEEAVAWTTWWNEDKNRHPADPAEIWWTQYGWYYYNQRQECESNDFVDGSKYPVGWIVYQCP